MDAPAFFSFDFSPAVHRLFFFRDNDPDFLTGTGTIVITGQRVFGSIRYAGQSALVVSISHFHIYRRIVGNIHRTTGGTCRQAANIRCREFP